MFQSDKLNQYLQTSDTIKNESKVFAEWNMNDPENIKNIGNYRYRPSNQNSEFYIIPTSYNDDDPGMYWTGATNCDTVIESGLKDDDQPNLFVSPVEKMKMLFSLEDCIKPFRPRSGINKIIYLNNSSFGLNSVQFIDDLRSQYSNRPRYYMASRDDQFKYWTSYRTELGTTTQVSSSIENSKQEQVVRGVSFYDPATSQNYIEDAAPFVVYNNEIPTNKIVIKMQTNVGDQSIGQIKYNNLIMDDPLYGDQNKTVPKKWSIEVLKNNTWQNVISFDENSTKENGEPLIGADGYVQISYGIKVPLQYKKIYNFIEEINNETLLPDSANEGDAYLVVENENSIGLIFIWHINEWKSFVPEYGWFISSEEINEHQGIVTKISNPEYYISGTQKIFREIDIISGIRIVVKTMNKPNCTFDLIEFSPRIFANISDTVSSFSITKTMSDLGNSSIPVGDILASTGSLQIFDTDLIFNENNIFDKKTGQGSIIAKYLSKQIKFIFYEKIYDDFELYIPLKTMYSTVIPKTNYPDLNVEIELRDFFMFLEASKAPQLFLTDISASYAIALLLDFIGFSNYSFVRSVDEELVIPYFFVEPGQNVAEVMKKIAMAAQSAMFFDEYNNLIIMSKDYIIPNDTNNREISTTLYGEEEAICTNGNSYKVNGYLYSFNKLPAIKEFGCYINVTSNTIYAWSDITNFWQEVGQLEKIIKPNIISFSSQEKKVYNDGRINYTTRYLQRSIGSLRAAPFLDEYKNYVYKPVLLWEAAGNTNRQTVNEIAAQSSAFMLGAVPLNSNLTLDPPYALNNKIYNNIIDVGDNVYWVTNYQGFFYANGEIIKYDAVEYSISGVSSPVWITSNEQYQKYFANLPFNGKMYPTGRLRIYTNPEYVYENEILTLKNANPIKEHGRGQFGTKITNHTAGIEDGSYWKNNQNVYGCIQEASSYLFNPAQYITYPTPLTANIAGKSKIISGKTINADTLSKQSYRTGTIKNFLVDVNSTELSTSYQKTTLPGTIQSSALNFIGPQITQDINPTNFVSYIYKDFKQNDGTYIPYIHYGSRMRIIGKIESNSNQSQSALGASEIYSGSISSDGYISPYVSANNNATSFSLTGGSGGIGINIDNEKNTGYFLEIVALNTTNIKDYANVNNNSKVSYNIVSNPAPVCVDNEVTVWTDTEIDFVVGQPVIISGLVDAADPSNPTLLNGEYNITAINENKKSFKYKINTTLNTTSITGGNVSINIEDSFNFANVIFYKVVSDANNNAIPYKLWSGLTYINVDSGQFYGQSRVFGEENTTVYDLAIEYSNIGSSRKFYLYLNDNQIATVTDSSPLKEKHSLALFVRGQSNLMFENVYALCQNYSENSVSTIANSLPEIFGDTELNTSEVLRKYSISGLVQQTYLSGISSLTGPKYNMYFEEFGTILRECAYFNILYDRAYPALTAKIMKPANNLRGYAVSGFYAWSYGAEFLIFNCSDFAIALDDTSGNYLRIMGTAFTQSTAYSLTVDDLYRKRLNIQDYQPSGQEILMDSTLVEKEYNRIKNSRDRYGKNEITIESPYIQTTDAAENIFKWVMDNVSKPRKVLGINVFGVNNLQLGDLVSIKYINDDGMNLIISENQKFIVYHIEYSKKSNEISTTIYLVEA